MNKRSHLHKKADSSASNPVLSQFQSRPNISQANPLSQKPLTQTQTENQEFQQQKFEATKLELQAKYGTITPEGQERLTVLQAKMSGLLQTRLEQALSNGSNFANIPISRPDAPSLEGVQTKLTNGEQGDKYAQEADRGAKPVVLQLKVPPRKEEAEVFRGQQENKTGLPDHIKVGTEILSGVPMDHVTVHENSNIPKEHMADAISAGNHIYVASGKKTNSILSHEAWHEAQKRQGKVKTTLQMNGFLYNDQPELEKEADIMGAKAEQVGRKAISGMPTQRGDLASPSTSFSNVSGKGRSQGIVQGIFSIRREYYKPQEKEQKGELITEPVFINELWLQQVIKALGEKCNKEEGNIEVEGKIKEEVGEDNWEKFKEKVKSEEETELGREPDAQKIYDYLCNCNLDFIFSEQEEDSEEDTDYVPQAKSQGEETGEWSTDTETDESEQHDEYAPSAQYISEDPYSTHSEPEFSSESESEGEQSETEQGVQRDASTAHVDFSTHNIHKIGKGTKNLSQKIKQVSGAVEVTQPDFATYQEVSDPQVMKRLLEINDRGADKEQPEKILEQFSFVPGPTYKSGSYKETYAGLANQAKIHFPPALYYIDPESGEKVKYETSLAFGSQAQQESQNPNLKQARPTSYWVLHLPASQWNLRPAQKGMNGGEQKEYKKKKDNLSHRENALYFKVVLINVHTSPGGSNTPSINQQMETIEAQLEEILKHEPNTVAIGDFYMQQGAKNTWKKLSQGTLNLRIVAPKTATNFDPKSGEARQTADHFLMPPEMREAKAKAYPPQKSFAKDSKEKLEKLGQEDKNLAEWTNYGIDHAFVQGSASVPITETVAAYHLMNETETKSEWESKYTTNNCLIKAIADAANVPVNREEIKKIRLELKKLYGIAPIEYLEADEKIINTIGSMLKISGPVIIKNMDNLSDKEKRVEVEKKNKEQTPKSVTIKFSRSQFYAEPVKEEEEKMVTMEIRTKPDKRKRSDTAPGSGAKKGRPEPTP